MNGCPKCGSLTQLEEIARKTLIADNEVAVIRDYACDCGCTFCTQQIFVSIGKEEIVRDE